MMDNEHKKFIQLLKETTAKLKTVNELKQKWRWNISKEDYSKFVAELELSNKWASSHCEI